MIVRLSNRDAVYMPCVGMASDSFKTQVPAMMGFIHARSASDSRISLMLRREARDTILNTRATS